MELNVTFYQFSKRTNSTKIVNVSGTALTCELKGSTSIFAPVLIIKNVPAAWNPMWNYCYIPGFDRYYFVNNWTWLNGIWECSLACDVLASFKTEIGNMSEYVLRSSYESDGRIIDESYVAKTQVQTDMTLLPEFYVRVTTAGFYIIGIISNEQNATQGAITYYQMSPAEMARLREYMLSDTFLQNEGLTNLTDFVPADATKVIYNPYQYIVSCKWFPFPMTAIDSNFKHSVNVINFGWWNTGTGFSAYRLDANLDEYSRTENITLQWHPQSQAPFNRGEYLNHAPYTSRVLRLAPFPDVQLPDEYLEYDNHLTIELRCDFITGMGYLLLYARDSGNVNIMQMARLSAMLGVDIQLAQIGADLLGADVAYAQSTLSFLKGASSDVGSGMSTLFNSAGSVSGAVTAGAGIAMTLASRDVFAEARMSDYLRNAAPQLLTTGQNGSFAAYGLNNYLCTTFFIIIPEDNEQLGRPLCKIRTLNTIPGFIMVRQPDVAISCFETERAMIAGFLASGFFYE